MLFNSLKVFQVYFVGLFEVSILHKDLGLKPHEFKFLKFNEFLIPIRSLLSDDFFQGAVDNLQCFRMIFLLFESIIELFLFLQEDFIKIQGAGRL